MPDPTYNENKVRFGLRKVHYALGTPDGEGGYTYGTPIPFPGAVSLNMDPRGDTEIFYADDIEYYLAGGSNGYDGSLEVARARDNFREDVMNESLDANGVLNENANAEAKVFALLFEFEGDQRARRHALYGCKAGRPSLSGKTTEGSKTPETETIPITSTPDKDGKVKASTTATTPAATYDAWYDSVYGMTATGG